MIDTYLRANASTLASGTAIEASWTIPKGAEGIDRLGISVGTESQMAAASVPPLLQTVLDCPGLN